jgi:serine/threonine protein kinase
MSDAPVRPAAKSARSSVRVGPFSILDEIGTGGMARVFRARYAPEGEAAQLPLDVGDVVVVKVMRRQSDAAPEEAEMFNREAEILVTLDHPGIVSAISRGVHAGRVWIALEYVEGEDLGNVIHAFHNASLRMKPDVAIALLSDVAQAIAAAHALVDPRGRPLGLVHRDLSPSNILLDIGGFARLFDFGNAIFTTEGKPTEGVIGSPGYLAPEQARQEQATPATDVYALGVLLYELLSGRRAFPVENMPDDAVVATHAAGARPRWPERIVLPPELTELTNRMLSPDPSERPADGGALYYELQNFVGDMEKARSALSIVARDLVLSNRQRPAPIYLSH